MVVFLQRFQAWLVACPLYLRWWACALHLALITVLSLVPAWLFPPSLNQIPGIDKWLHGAMYGLLGGLLRWAAAPRGATALSYGWPVAAGGYGLLMELMQLQFGGGTRMFSGGDAVANLIGAIVFWGLAGRFLEKARVDKS